MGRNRVLQGEQLDQVLQLIKDGVRYAVLAEQFSVSTATIAKCRRDAGVEPVFKARGKTQVTDEKLAAILARFDEEKSSWDEMSAEFELSPTILKRLCREAGRGLRSPHFKKQLKVTPEVIERVKQMRAEKQPWKLISRKTGLSAQTIVRRIRKVSKAA